MISFLPNKNIQSNVVNFLFSIIPASYIAGTLVLNLNIALFLISTILFYGKNVFRINLHLVDKLILFFFTFVLFTGIFNFIDLHYFKGEDYALTKNFGVSVLIKSLSYTRYLLLYFVVRFLIENKIINFKIFLISCAFFTLFVSFDIFYQLIFGKDIFGFEPSLQPVKYSGPFDYEYVAGGYLQRFVLLSLFLIPVFYKSKSKTFLFISTSIMFVIYLSAIIISGNRMPLLLFLFMIFLLSLLEKKLRKYLIYYLSASILIFMIILNLNESIKNNFINFSDRLQTMSKSIITMEMGSSRENSNLKEFTTFYGTWQMNKYIGGGIKSFRINCWQRKNIQSWESGACNTHPLNYYLEILTDLGIVGFFILSTIFLIVIYQSIVKRYFFSTDLKNNSLMTPFMFIFLMEVFPIKSSGSFFTTTNATFFFLILAITVAFSRKLDLN